MDTSPRFGPTVETSRIDLLEIAQVEGAPIGKVESVTGNATVIRTDGSTENAEPGMQIFLGDEVQTDDAGAIGLVFADDSTFSLAEGGAMTIDEMVYDPASQEGTSAFNVAQGVFTFVSGQIAKSGVDNMIITTPVATIGIRGSSGGGRIDNPAFRDPDSDLPPSGLFSNFRDPATGLPGEITINTPTGAQVLNSINATTQVPNPFVPPTQVIILPPAAVKAAFLAAARALPVIVSGGQAQGAGNQGSGGDPVEDTIVQPDPTSGDGAATAAEEAAAEAFTQVLAQGGDIDAAMLAAVEVGTQIETQFGLGADEIGQFNPDDIVGNIIDDVVVGILNDAIPGIGFFGGADGGGDAFDDYVLPTRSALRSFVDELGFVDPILLGGPGDDLGLFGPTTLEEQLLFEELLFEQLLAEAAELEAQAEALAALESPPEETTFVVTLSDGTVVEVTSATTGDDNLVGGDGVNDFFMSLGDTMSGTDTIDGGGGNDELTLLHLEDGWLKYDSSTSPQINYTFTSTSGTAPGTYSGTVALTSVEGIFASDGIEGFADVVNGGASRNTAGDAVQLQLNSSGTGYIRAGTDGNDTLTVATGTNTGFGTISSSGLLGTVVFARDGNDTVTGSDAGDIIFGGSGLDTLSGGAGNDTISGGEDADEIHVGTGTDFADGGDDGDTYVFAASEATSGDNINDTGTFGNDYIRVDGDNDFTTTTISGVEGFMFNAAATAKITASQASGFSAFQFNNSFAETLQIQLTADGTLNASGFTLTNFVSGTDTIEFIGSTGNESITGTDNNDTFTFSNSSFSSGDTLVGGNGTDTLSLTGGGTVADATFTNVSNLEAIQLDDATYNLVLTTNAANAFNNISITSNQTSNGLTLTANGLSADSITLSASSSTATDNISGSQVADTINTGGGDDTITGNGGADNLTGGSGSDTFVMSSVSSFGDTITDFTGGAAGDIYDFNVTVSRGSNTGFQIVSGNDILNTNGGVVSFTDNVTNYTTAGDVAAALSGLSGVSASNRLLFAVGNGTNTQLWYWNDTTNDSGSGDNDGAIDSGELQKVAHLDSVQTSNLTEDNFSGFSDVGGGAA